jgi:ElaB/YqjD/DUF883 family membrane-anchored ribosome-binding protein
MKHNGEHQHNGGRDPNAILKEIERTREEMDSTLTAIEHRLTPGQLVDQGLDYLRKSGANEFVQNLGGQVKHNPLPVALVGIGVAWLMVTGRQQQSASSSAYMDTDYVDAGSGRSGLGDRAHQTVDRASGMAQSAKDKLSQSTQAVRDRLSQAGSSINSAGQSARQRVGDLTESARYQVERAKDGMDYMMREQPLALGAIGVAIGAVIAAMAPRTRKEDELMGDTRDRLVDQAKEVGQQKLEQAKEVANAAVGTATKEAEQRGLKPNPAPAQSARPDSAKQDAGKPTVGVHHSFSDAPAQTVPPTPQTELPRPQFGPKPKATPAASGGPRNTP